MSSTIGRHQGHRVRDGIVKEVGIEVSWEKGPRIVADPESGPKIVQTTYWTVAAKRWRRD